MEVRLFESLDSRVEDNLLRKEPGNNRVRFTAANGVDQEANVDGAVTRKCKTVCRYDQEGEQLEPKRRVERGPGRHRQLKNVCLHWRNVCLHMGIVELGRHYAKQVRQGGECSDAVQRENRELMVQTLENNRA